MLRAYKYRIVPTMEQKELINKHIGSCRFVYNLALEINNYVYSTQGKRLSCYDLISQLPELKKECKWLTEVDSQSLQQAIINLYSAFNMFFKGASSFPTFKNKQNTQSFRNPHGTRVEIKGGKIFQPKFKDGIKIIIDREFYGEIRSTTISKTTTGKYFVSVLVDNKKKPPKLTEIRDDSAIGIDLGIKDLIVTSKNVKITNPKYLKKSLLRLKYLSRQHSKKKKGGKNRKKSTLKLALQHEKTVNRRKDFLHKVSSQLIKSHDTLCFETLRIDNMVKNRKLSRSISDSGWRIFIEMCKYKAEWNGKNILHIPTFQSSTKICNICNHVNNTLTLSDREWVCAKCNTNHDRDLNAAINIKKYALKNCGGVRREKSVELSTLVGA